MPQDTPAPVQNSQDISAIKAQLLADLQLQVDNKVKAEVAGLKVDITKTYNVDIWTTRIIAIGGFVLYLALVALVGIYIHRKTTQHAERIAKSYGYEEGRRARLAREDADRADSRRRNNG